MKRAAIWLVGAALVVGACGDDGDADDVPATEPTTTEPVTTEPPATEPPATEPPATEPPSTEPPATEPPQTTTTEPPPPPVEAVGLVPLPGASFDFSGRPAPESALVWSLYSGSGGVVVEHLGGPLPPGCHGTSFFDPDTFELLQIDGEDLEAYATRGAGGCGGMQADMEEGVVDGPAVAINDDELILFDFGALPASPFDVSTQVLDPDGADGVFRSADPLAPRYVNSLDGATHVIGADVLLEVRDDGLTLIEPPPPEAGVCDEQRTCFLDRFIIDVVTTDAIPGQLLVANGPGGGSGLFTFTEGVEWEALVRVVNGCRINDHFWVFAAGSTQVEFEVTVTDTLVGESQTYGNPLDNLPAPTTDPTAFATCP